MYSRCSDIVIIDSIQTLHSDYIESSAGSISQIRETTSELIKFAKETAIGEIKKTGAVIEGVLDPQAKVIDFADLRKEMHAWWEANPGYADTFPEDFYGAYSSFGAARGYDAIRVVAPKISWQPDAEPINATYTIVLNRTALILKEQP